MSACLLLPAFADERESSGRSVSPPPLGGSVCGGQCEADFNRGSC